MKKLIIIMFLLLIPSIASAEWFSWDETNTKLHVPLTLLMVADLGQTLDIADNCAPRSVTISTPSDYQAPAIYSNVGESNGNLGYCPSRDEVKEHFLWSYIFTTAVTYVLPSKASHIFQGSAITVELYYVGSNYMLGVGIAF